MRIQHNIMAMNAYRNYNTNTKALSGNLEKLSSGYKINRAGDDAAGLAISEKMRAQITGLDAAQKNVKDGISLVKTAEGAMQEIQDMLNRMDYLATQSANGTYDNEVDRLNLQKEVTALKEEINRIADSANFNGIKLLDGSLSSGEKAAVEAKEGNFNISTKTGELQDDLGTKTITHTSGIDPSKATFGVELGDLEFSNGTGESLKLKIGGHEITIEASDNTHKIDSVDPGDKVTAKNIVNAIVAATDGTTGPVKVDGTDVKITAAGKIEIGGSQFDVKASDTGTGLVFTQTDNNTVFEGDLAVSVEPSGTDAVTPGGAPTGTLGKDTPDAVTGDATKNTTYTYDLAGLSDLTAGSYTVGIASKTVNVTLEDGKTTLNDLAKAVVDALNADEKNAIEDNATNGTSYAVTATGSTVVFTSAAKEDTTAKAVSGNLTVTPADAKAEGYVKGTYNTQTTQTVSAAGVEKKLASTVITLDADKMSNGSKIRFGETEYEFSSNEADKNSTTKVYVGDLDLNTKEGLKTAIDRLSVVAADNDVWAIGYAGEGGKVTVTEKADDTGKGWMDQDNGNNKKIFDLTTVEGIKASLGYKSAAQDAVEGDPDAGLTLQIGDTSDSFNQMKVKVGDMHVDAMGTGTYKDENGKEVEISQTIADIDIGNQQGAADAIQVIRNAINYVSGVRGDLGAIQNRLEHTGNNLSVMAENIQDAESTIRDTDVANEMMGYVKNNILVQSAQAMLAQANQVPQGVLQLLG